MSYPHRMRLNGPWQLELLARADEAGPIRPDSSPPLPLVPSPASSPARLTVPGDWGNLVPPGFQGTVRLRRRFGRPAQLDPHERCWLSLGGVDPAAVAFLNDEPLGVVSGYALGASWEIASRLEPRNELRLDLTWPADPQGPAPLRPGRAGLAGGILGDVQLEIDGGGCVSDLALAIVASDPTAPELRLSGLVNARPESAPLAVVVNGLGRELAYREVARGETLGWRYPLGEGSSWAGEGHENRAGLVAIEVKLIAGGTSVWQRTAAAGPARSVVESGERAAPTAAPPCPSLPWVDYHATPAELPQVFISRAICPEQVYSVCDQSGRRLVQRLPAAWAARVGPALAHHPSIVAWTATAHELDSARDALRETLDDGRPWFVATPESCT